jgi:hypothetical protein
MPRRSSCTAAFTTDSTLDNIQPDMGSDDGQARALAFLVTGVRVGAKNTVYTDHGELVPILRQEVCIFNDCDLWISRNGTFTTRPSIFKGG